MAFISSRSAWLVGFFFVGMSACAVASPHGSDEDGGGPPHDVDDDVDSGRDALVGEDGGDGGTPPSPSCDDHNPCTDDRAEGSECRFVAVEDGRPCDDGDFCTLGDRCQAGACVSGARSSGPLARLGTLDSLAGGAFGVVGNRFLAVTGPGQSSHLQLAERRGTSLEVVASWKGGLPYVDAFEATFVESLDGDLVALAGRGTRAVAILSVSSSSGAASPTIAKRSIPELDGQIVSLAAHGKRIWTCTRDFFLGSAITLVDVSDPDAASVVGTLGIENCGSIATSDDGKRVYVNTQDGVRFVDASPLETGGDPVLSDVFAPNAGLSTGSGHIILREKSSVRILRQSDHTEVASIPESGVLAASLIGTRLLVEGWRDVSGGMEAFVALYDALGAKQPVRLDEVILQKFPSKGDVGSSFPNAVTADGSAVITKVGQRLFDLTRGRLDEVRVPALTPFDQLSPASAGVRVVGYASTAVVDVHDPAKPVLAGGGAFGIPLTFNVTLEESAPGPKLFFGGGSNSARRAGVGRSWEPNPLPVERWMLDADGRRQLTGSFRLPNDGEGELLMAGGGLYRMRLPVSPKFDVTLQSWTMSTLGRAGELAQPAFDLPLSPSTPLPVPSGTSSGSWGAFDVDPRAERAVVTIGMWQVGGALLWLDLTTVPPKVVDEVHLDADLAPMDVRISGTRAVVSTGLELVWIELGKGVVSRVEASTLSMFIPHLLGFDGNFAYFAADTRKGLGVAAFGKNEMTQLLLGDAPRSMLETDGALVLGLPNQLVTVRPHCE